MKLFERFMKHIEEIIDILLFTIKEGIIGKNKLISIIYFMKPKISKLKILEDYKER